MSDFLNKSSVLVLNSLFQAIGTLSVKKAMVAMNSQSIQDSIVARPIDVIYKKNEDGSINVNELDYWQPLSFEEWLIVEPRDGIDNIIHTPRLSIRAPTLVVTSYSKMPMRRFRATKGVLYDLQEGRCGYTGEHISPKQGNIEHKIPKSKGGRDTFSNLMIVKKEINFKRGNKDLSEMGLVPLFSHKEPRPMPVHHTIKNIQHPDWVWFLPK